MKPYFRYTLMFLYFSITFFFLGIVIRVASGFFYMSKFYLPYEGMVSNFIKSLIAGAAITLAAIVFNLIDKHKARKSPPSDPDV